MAKDAKTGRPRLRYHIANSMAAEQGKRPKLLPPHQRAMPERDPEFFVERKFLKSERLALLQQSHEKKKHGRPLEYQGEVHDDMLFDMRLLGATKEIIAASMFTDVATITRWLNKYSSFSAAWEAGGDQADAAILRKMHQKAMGYEHRTTKVFQYQGEIIEHDVVEVYAPDQKAAEFLLTNRQRGNWRHRQDSSLVDNDGNAMQPPTLIVLPVEAHHRADDDEEEG